MTKTKTKTKATAKAKPIKKVTKKAVVKKEVVKKEKKDLYLFQIEKELKKLYPKKSAGQIAREAGVTRGAVLSQLRKFGIEITTRTSSKTGPAHLRKDTDRSFHEKDYLIKQLKAGLSIYKISLICSTTYLQVQHFVKKHDLMAMVEANRAKKKAAPKVKKVAKKDEKKATKAPAKKAVKVKAKKKDEMDVVDEKIAQIVS